MEKQQKKETKGFPLRFFDPKVKSLLESIAEANKRSLNAEINYVLEDYVKYGAGK